MSPASSVAAMPISSPTLRALDGDVDPSVPAIGFTFRAAWPENEQASASIAIAELLELVRSMVSSRFRDAQTTSAVIAAPSMAATPALVRAPEAVADLVVDRLSRRVVVFGRSVELTLREFDLLAHLVGHPDRVLTREQLINAVWNHAGGNGRTVDVHVARLRRKLADARVALQTVRGVGYRWHVGSLEVMVVSA
jgi:DNA-binding response OmpR family regulator